MVDIIHQFVRVSLLLFLCSWIDIIPLRFRTPNNKHLQYSAQHYHTSVVKKSYMFRS